MAALQVLASLRFVVTPLYSRCSEPLLLVSGTDNVETNLPFLALVLCC